MADVRPQPTNDRPGNLPPAAADAGQVAVYDNDTTDSRPASVLETPRDGTHRVEPITPPSSGGGMAWIIGIVILALLLFFAFRILF